VYSWPLFEKSPWPAQSLFGASFICSLISVRKALQQSYILRRLELHNDNNDDRMVAGDRVRRQLARRIVKGEEHVWVPDIKFQMIWNSSHMFLNLGILSLVAGYAWMILASAIEKGKNSDKNGAMVCFKNPVQLKLDFVLICFADRWSPSHSQCLVSRTLLHQWHCDICQLYCTKARKPIPGSEIMRCRKTAFMPLRYPLGS
jgi:hypothetical protein